MPQETAIEAVIAIVVAALIFAAGLFVGDHYAAGRAAATIAKLQADQAAYVKAIDDNALAADRSSRKTEQDWQQRVAAIDNQKTKELADAQKQNDDLREQLATGAVRVRVKATCPTVSRPVPGAAAAARVDDGEATAELDGSTAATLAGIAGTGDKAITMLDALQSYVQAITRQKN